MIDIQGKSKKFLVIAAFLCFLCMGTVQHASASTNVVTSAKVVYGGKWKQTSEGRMYRYSKTAYAKNGWRKIGRHIYYFDKAGICRTGWISYEGNKYYANKKGKLCIGKWVQIGTKRYYFAANGRLQKNRFIKSGEKYYYVNKKGVNIKARWVKVNGKRYYIDRNGARLQNIWLKTKDGKYYYLESDGVMAVNKYIGSHYVGPDGVRTDAPQETEEAYIFVGDSRTVGMGTARPASHTKYIAEVGMGYKWLSTAAGKKLEKQLEKNPSAKVIFGFGVNDLGNIQNYITYYRTIMQRYPRAKFYVMSVNPVEHKLAEKHNYTVKNAQIKRFNAQMKAAFGASYIDTFTYLKNKGFETVDGIHYTAQTYGEIYDYVMALIK